jgi:hypothetical protein
MKLHFLRPAGFERACCRRRFTLCRQLAGLVVLGALGTVVVGALHGSVALAGDVRDGTTGTISDAKAVITEDGTREHPYADASQCPRNTDLVFWSNSARDTRSTVYIPPEISVCFVETQSFDNSRDLPIHHR